MFIESRKFKVESISIQIDVIQLCFFILLLTIVQDMNSYVLNHLLSNSKWTI